MAIFLAGLALFFGVHLYSALRSRDPDKDIKKRLGYGPYMGFYSLASLIGFGLIIYGFSQTRGSGLLYDPPVWTRHLNLLLMLPAMIILTASQLPTGKIKQTLKHPMLVAVKIWAVGHLLANGEYNSVILFGSFLAYAVFDRIMVKKRGDIGPGPEAAASLTMDIVSVAVGAALWGALAFWLHPILFGVAVIG